MYYIVRKTIEDGTGCMKAVFTGKGKIPWEGDLRKARRFASYEEAAKATSDKNMEIIRVRVRGEDFT